MPPRMLVFGFSVILFNIFPPLVYGPGDGHTERDHPHDGEHLRGDGAHEVERPGSNDVVVCHGSIGAGGWQYAALGFAAQ